MPDGAEGVKAGGAAKLKDAEGVEGAPKDGTAASVGCEKEGVLPPAPPPKANGAGRLLPKAGAALGAPKVGVAPNGVAGAAGVLVPPKLKTPEEGKEDCTAEEDTGANKAEDAPPVPNEDVAPLADVAKVAADPPKANTGVEVLMDDAGLEVESEKGRAGAELAAPNANGAGVLAAGLGTSAVICSSPMGSTLGEVGAAEMVAKDGKGAARAGAAAALPVAADPKEEPPNTKGAEVSDADVGPEEAELGAVEARAAEVAVVPPNTKGGS